MKKLLATLATLAAISLGATLVVFSTSAAFASHSCTGANIERVSAGQDLDAVVNADASGTATTFCIETGTYTINQTLILRGGDEMRGHPGNLARVGPATKPTPVVKIKAGSNNLDNLMRPRGNNIEVSWLDMSGANARFSNGNPVSGTGTAIAAGSADGRFVAQYMRIHNNEGAGISNAKGRILDSEFFSNTEDPQFVKFIGSAVKGLTEFEAARNFVHNEQGNGLWCDVGCVNDSLRANGAWFHENVTVNNGRWGLRYESSPRDLATGVHTAKSTFLAENNKVAGNGSDGSGGASNRDAQNGMWRNNEFGPQTIAGKAYGHNNKNLALVISDSGRQSRTDLWNADAVNNILHGEELKGCELPDKVVACSGNTP